MTTMTIHTEDALAVALREYAAKLGKCVSRTVKDLFSPMLGLTAEEARRVNPHVRFAGALLEIDVSLWDAEIPMSPSVDAELWK